MLGSCFRKGGCGNVEVEGETNKRLSKERRLEKVECRERSHLTHM